MGWLLMVSPIFNLLDCEILPKRKEIFDKYCKIIRWGRANPTRFIEDFFKLQLTDMQKYVLMSSWIPANIVWLMGRNSRKAMSLDTPVYYRTTDRGEKIEKKTIGDLKIGDVIYDESGNLTVYRKGKYKYDFMVCFGSFACCAGSSGEDLGVKLHIRFGFDKSYSGCDRFCLCEKQRGSFQLFGK